MAGAKRRTKQLESNRAISAGEWTSELIGAWDAAQDLVAHAVALSHPKPGWTVLTFPDASDEHWGSFVLQVPHEELDNGVLVEIRLEPLGFLSRTFKGSASVGDGGQGMFHHGEYLQEVGVPLVEGCAHLY